MITVQPGSGPTVLRILLGSQLRGLREVKGITREEAGYAIRASGSKISRMELGRVGFKERDVTDLLEMYGVSDETETSQRWWRWPERRIRPAGGTNTAMFCRTGSRCTWAWRRRRHSSGCMRCSSCPGLLQTAGLRPRGRGGSASPARRRRKIERRVSLRMARQELLRKPGGPRLWASWTRRRCAARSAAKEVMRAQLERLIQATEEPHITLQVCHSGQAATPPKAGAFTIMRFPEPDLPDVVYWSSSQVPFIWTSATTSRSTPRSWSVLVSRVSRQNVLSKF